MVYLYSMTIHRCGQSAGKTWKVGTMKYCGCGCGCVIPDHNRFKFGHSRIGTHHTTDTKRRIVHSNKETYAKNPELRKAIGKRSSAWHKGRTYEEMYGLQRATENKEKHRQAQLGRKVTNWAMKYSGRKKNEIRKRVSTSMKRTIAKMLTDAPEAYMEWRNKNFKSCFARPSSLERAVIAMNIPHLQYVGNGKLWLKLKHKTCNPDFIVTPFEETKSVLEVFGGLGYFHTKAEAKTLAKQYKKIGVRCLIIFDDDLKSPAIKHRIEKFVSSSKNPQRLHAHHLFSIG